MKLFLTLLLTAAVVSAGSVTPELSQEMLGSTGDELIRVLIKPLGAADTDYIMSATSGMTRDQIRAFAADVMRDRAELAQAGILEYLSLLPAASVDDVHPFWIVNAIAVSLTPDAIRDVAAREDVLYVRYMRKSNILIEPVETGPGEASRANAWGVDKINAPDVWAMGYEGSGVIVSVVDTGVNYNHMDLHNNMWHDTGAGYHYGWDFDDNDGDPMDSYGHGTHCAGSVASDGTAGTVCGVAPAATIMALRVGVSFSDEQDVWDAFQFSIDNDADVISTSLGWPQSQSPDRQEWREVEDNVLAAGICHSIAAGNEGGNPNTYGDIRTPGDAPPPWLHPDQITSGGLSAVVTVGATDSNDNIASFSSVGYSTWMYDAPWYDYPDTSPDIGLIDPDISGPGVDVLSCQYSSNDGYTTMSGTSMATPHLAGCMALLLEADPTLTPAEVDSLLETTAVDYGDTGKDNVFGAGRVDIYQAVLAATGGQGIEGGEGPSQGLILSISGPNPVMGSVVFDLYTGMTAEVDISVFDLSGRIVAVIDSGDLDAGSHSFSWSAPSSLGSGVYFIRASSPQFTASERFTLIR